MSANVMNSRGFCAFRHFSRRASLIPGAEGNQYLSIFFSSQMMRHEVNMKKNENKPVNTHFYPCRWEGGHYLEH